MFLSVICATKLQLNLCLQMQNLFHPYYLLADLSLNTEKKCKHLHLAWIIHRIPSHLTLAVTTTAGVVLVQNCDFCLTHSFSKITLAKKSRLILLFPLVLFRHTVSFFVCLFLEDHDGERMNQDTFIYLFLYSPACAVSYKTTQSGRMVTRVPSGTASQGICQDKSHWTCCDECFLSLRELLSVPWYGEKTGRKVGLMPVGKSVVCLAWMILCFASRLHKMNWVTAFSLMKWLVWGQSRK